MFFLIPFPIYLFVVVFAIIFGLFYVADRACNGDGWLASTLLYVAAVAVAIGFPVRDYAERPVKDTTKEIVFVDNKAVISEDDSVVQLSRVTGESYKKGDVVKFKEYGNQGKYFDFCLGWKDRIKDFEVVLHEAE